MKRQVLKVSEEGELTENITQMETPLSEAPDPKNDSVSENGFSNNKKHPDNQDTATEMQDSSTKFDFDHPIITLDNDNAIWAGSIKKNDKDSSSVYSLFLVKPGPNLKATPNGTKFIKKNSRDIFKDYKYTIPKIFLLDGNPVLISNCIHRYYQTIAPANWPTLTQPYANQFNTSRQVEMGEISSLRIIQLDKSLNIVNDTSIEANSPYSKLYLEDPYYYTSTTTINLLCLQQFSHKLSGIRHIAIGKNFIQGIDFQVDPRYNYLLSNLKMIDDITFLIPYTHHGKIGFMKFTNTAF